LNELLAEFGSRTAHAAVAALLERFRPNMGQAS